MKSSFTIISLLKHHNNSGLDTSDLFSYYSDKKLQFQKVRDLAVAGVAQWIECQPANQRVADSIPSLGHMPGFWAKSPVGGHRRGNSH